MSQKVSPLTKAQIFMLCAEAKLMASAVGSMRESPQRVVRYKGDALENRLPNSLNQRVSLNDECPIVLVQKVNQEHDSLFEYVYREECKLCQNSLSVFFI